MTQHKPSPWSVNARNGVIVDASGSVLMRLHRAAPLCIARLACAAPDLMVFAETIAQMETAEETDERTNGEGMSGDDAVETLSSLIKHARQLVASAKA